LDKDKKFSAVKLASDSWISTQIESKLLFAKDIASVNYSTETIDGNVYLMGVAQNKEELENVAKIASQISGVKKVVSHVRIKGIPQNSPNRITRKPVINPVVDEAQEIDVDGIVNEVFEPQPSKAANELADKYYPPESLEEIEGISKP